MTSTCKPPQPKATSSLGLQWIWSTWGVVAFTFLAGCHQSTSPPKVQPAPPAIDSLEGFRNATSHFIFQLNNNDAKHGYSSVAGVTRLTFHSGETREILQGTGERPLTGKLTTRASWEYAFHRGPGTGVATIVFHCREGKWIPVSGVITVTNTIEDDDSPGELEISPEKMRMATIWF